jgi:bidirectional [NiFe] hydrogenase diaphorase subunit
MAQTIRTAAESDAHPSGDGRFQMLDTSMKRNHYRPDALIEVLHTAQDIFGHLDHDVLLYVARGLKLPPSRVYGVATFYHLFRFKARGEHQCTVCLGTACFVKGGADLLAVVEQATGIHAGQTLPDGRLSLDTARCLGACGIAPVVVFDGTVCGHQRPEVACERVKGWLSHGPERAQTDRGA